MMFGCGDHVSSVLRSMRRWLVLALLVPAGALALASCSSRASAGAPAAIVVMRDFSYTPQTLRVAVNARVTVVNEGSVVHNWIIQQAGVGTGDVQPGATQTLDLTGIPAGTYRVYCDQPGHAAQGQTGLIVIAATG
ncbi:MAG: cupredoxin domain-containing protein [Acidimicrobiales bacterium]